MFPKFSEPLVAIFVFPVNAFFPPKSDNTNLHCDNRNLHCNNTKLHCLGLIALLSANQSCEIFSCILLAWKKTYMLPVTNCRKQRFCKFNPHWIHVIKYNFLHFEGISSKCLKCICDVESNCNTNVQCGDNGRSCGPYQIQKGYWSDAGSYGTDYRSCVATISCSENTVKGMSCKPNVVFNHIYSKRKEGRTHRVKCIEDWKHLFPVVDNI